MRLTPLLAALALALGATPARVGAQAKSDADTKARDAAINAQIRSYRCVTKEGRKYYGSTVPPQCTGELVEALSVQGTVLRRIEPPLTAEQRAAKEAREAKTAQAEAEKQAAERRAQAEARRDRALLQSYTSENDIEMVRQRALAENRIAAAQVQLRIEQLKQRQDKLAKEVLKYKAGQKPPDQLEADVKSVAYDLSLQEQLLASRNTEADAINERYEGQKRKYRELTAGAKK